MGVPFPPPSPPPPPIDPSIPTTRVMWIITSVGGAIVGILTTVGLIMNDETGNVLIGIAGAIGTFLGVSNPGALKFARP